MPTLKPLFDFVLDVLRIWKGDARAKAALLCITGGIGMLSQSIWMPVIQVVAVRVTGRTDIVTDMPLWLSVPLGGGLIATGLWLLSRVYGNQAAKPASTLIAIRHQSQEALGSQLTAGDLPASLGNAAILPLDVDQSSFYLDGRVHDVAGAVRVQERLRSKVEGMVVAHPGAEVAYYGIAHIPFAFLAGAELSTKPRIQLFELDRGSGRWRWVDAVAPGDDLGVTTAAQDSGEGTRDVAIRIAVSFPVPEADVAEALGRPFHDRLITVAAPARDIIHTTAQIEAVCKAFDRVLDELHNNLPKDVRVHVFYAGPVSLAFSLGRRVTRTIHHRIRVHNFEGRSTPKYAWSLDVSGGLLPQAMVERPVVGSGAATAAAE
ncbi:hypothetical protein M2352_004886 [Azospirillum fermentarium]|uniref:SAVED domain-containing protein n=1 Tax=Azospirillum fermentarium TaxID=1233114 RepID=UPI0022275FC9|nr:SAVED domain-containing protein [Azospirillum fermentarium]MCW2249226.1 hypothetical protein [Azospirillum fermentarium]